MQVCRFEGMFSSAELSGMPYPSRRAEKCRLTFQADRGAVEPVEVQGVPTDLAARLLGLRGVLTIEAEDPGDGEEAGNDARR